MKFLFIVQGEGRGHFTQAITLEEMLLRKKIHNLTVTGKFLSAEEFCTFSTQFSTPLCQLFNL